MIDARFYGEAKIYTVQALIDDLMQLCRSQTGENLPTIGIEGDPQHVIKGPSTLHDATSEHVSFFHKTMLKNVNYEEDLKQTKAGAVFIKEEDTHLVPPHVIRLIALRPYRAFAAALTLFYPDTLQSTANEMTHPTAVIDKTAILGKGCIIGPYVYIGPAVTLGDGCIIESHVSITHAMLGNNVRIKTGARIGQRGFGFEMDERGPVDMPQMGRVIIEDFVEIGANTCIDRGTFGDTIIGKGARIDNLVQIAHNVKVGPHSIIVAQVGISGSTTLGKGVIVAGQVGITGHLDIGDGSRIAAQSGVMRDVPAKTDMAGSPALPAREWRKQVVMLKRMIEK